MTNLPDLLTGTTIFMQLARQLENPSFPLDRDDPLRRLRVKLLDEEYLDEYIPAEKANDLVEVVDGLLDVIVISWGTLLAYIGPDKAAAAAAEVVRSNLSKVDGTLGPTQRRDDGKIIKPQGWTPPDIAGALS